MLNFVMIPEWGLGWGAMGASVATFASYFIVYVIRAVTMKRFLPINVYSLRFITNTVLIGAITAFMTYFAYSGEVWGCYTSIGILLFSVLFNGRDVFLICCKLLRSLKGRKKNNS